MPILLEPRVGSNSGARDWASAEMRVTVDGILALRRLWSSLQRERVGRARSVLRAARGAHDEPALDSRERRSCRRQRQRSDHGTTWSPALARYLAHRESHGRDLLESIERGEFPRWRRCSQVMTEGQAAAHPHHPFDLTEVWSKREFRAAQCTATTATARCGSTPTWAARRATIRTVTASGRTRAPPPSHLCRALFASTARSMQGNQPRGEAPPREKLQQGRRRLRRRRRPGARARQRARRRRRVIASR